MGEVGEGGMNGTATIITYNFVCNTFFQLAMEFRHRLFHPTTGYARDVNRMQPML